MKDTKKIDKFLNKRGPKTLVLTIILFAIGVK